MKRCAVMLALALMGCGLPAPTRGEVVAEGVGRALFETRNAGTDLIPVTVFFPADADGAPRARSAPALVFVQGGFVDRSRYEWQASELARAGFVVALPEHELELAFFSIDAGEAARRLLVNPPASSLLEGTVDPLRIAVAGHSLGSVVAAKLALDGHFNGLVLEAGFPDTADVSKLRTLAVPSLSLAGELDCSAKLPAVQEGWQALSTPTALVVLSGVTHYQFTNSQAEDERAGCTPGVSLDDAHASIAAALRAFLSDGPTSAALREVPGSTVEAR